MALLLYGIHGVRTLLGRLIRGTSLLALLLRGTHGDRVVPLKYAAVSCAVAGALAAGTASAEGGQGATVSVVAIVDLDTGRFCSGVVVRDRLVLTARHCVEREESGALVPAVLVTQEPLLVEARTSVRVTQIWTDRGELDVAALVTDGSAGVPVSAAHVPRGPLWFSGYGQHPGGGFGVRESFAAQVMRWQHHSIAVNPVLCAGDSGGPLLDADGALVAIASRRAAACWVGSAFFTDVRRIAVSDFVGLDVRRVPVDGVACHPFYPRLGCDEGTVCRLIAGQRACAVSQRLQGASCAADEECDSGRCIDGFCAVLCSRHFPLCPRGEACSSRSWEIGHCERTELREGVATSLPCDAVACALGAVCVEGGCRAGLVRSGTALHHASCPPGMAEFRGRCYAPSSTTTLRVSGPSCGPSQPCELPRECRRQETGLRCALPVAEGADGGLPDIVGIAAPILFFLLERGRQRRERTRKQGREAVQS